MAHAARIRRRKSDQPQAIPAADFEHARPLHRRRIQPRQPRRDTQSLGMGNLVDRRWVGNGVVWGGHGDSKDTCCNCMQSS